MQITIDTRNAAPGELNALARMFADLAGQPYTEATAVPAYAEDSEHPDNGGPDYVERAGGPDHEDGPEFEGYAERAGEDEPDVEQVADTSTGAPRDQHGVGFNNQYCSQAREPFYATGKRSGQWKKKKGVSDEEYDAWYAGELKAQDGPAATDEDSHQPEPVNTGAAFGNGQAAQQAPAAPQDTGEFMGWVSEKQAGGLITQDDIQQAYNAAGVQVTDLFPPNDPQTIAGRIRQLYDHLAQKAGA